jgi:hypothetical protein
MVAAGGGRQGSIAAQMLSNIVIEGSLQAELSTHAAARADGSICLNGLPDFSYRFPFFLISRAYATDAMMPRAATQGLKNKKKSI